MSQTRQQKQGQPERADTMGTNVYSANDKKSLHKSLNGEFILYQTLLKRILEGKNLSAVDTSSILKYFQPDDKKDKEVMKEFDTSYNPAKAIYWYTRETCVYKILNKALRTQNIDDVTPFGPFVRDLNTQLSSEHQKFIKQQKTPKLIVYRGQLISKDEVNRLKSSQNQLIAMNSFLSTSTNRKKALEFATSKPPPTDQLTAILLEITTPLNAISKPYADIKHLSAIPDEEEILFMLGAVFRINQIEHDENLKLWTAKFTLCSNNDPDMKEFLKGVEGELKGQNEFVALGNNYVQMLKYNEAEEHFEKILKTNMLKDPIEFAYCHHGLGKVHEKKANINLAIDHLNKALDYLSQGSPSKDHPLISQCYNDLGVIYANQSDSKSAYEYFDKAIDTKNNILSTTYYGLAQTHLKMKHYNLAYEYAQKTLKNQSETDHAHIAETHILMGNIYAAMNKKEKSTEMFEKAVQAQSKDLPPGHPDLGYSYSALGVMYAGINDYNKALEYADKAYQLQLKTLPNNHPDFAESFKNYGDLYMKMNDLNKALSSYEKLLENQLKTLLWTHPSVVETYNLIGNLHLKRKDFNQATVYFQKVVDAQVDRKMSGQAPLGIALKHLGDVYLNKYNAGLGNENLDAALNSYVNYLENEYQTKLKGDPSFIDIYGIIADLYYKNRQLDQSLIYNNHLLDCHIQKFPFDQTNIDKVYTLVGKLYLKKHHFDQTLIYYQKTQDTNYENQSSNDMLKNLGNIHFEKRHLEQVFNYYKKLVGEQSRKHQNNSASLADNYFILANIAYEQENYDQALFYFLRTLDTELQRKAPHDPSLQNTYRAIGTLYFQDHNYSQSLIYFNKLLDCQLQKNTIEHPSVLDTYTRIGNIYLKKHHSHRTPNFLNKSIENQLNSTKSEKKSDLHLTNVQIEQQHLEQAFNYFQNLLNRQTNQNLSLDDIYTILGNISLERQDVNQAVSFFQTLSKNQRKTDSKNNPLLAQTYLILGDTHAKHGQFDQALENYKKSLKIHQSIDPQSSLIRKIQHKMRTILVPTV